MDKQNVIKKIWSKINFDSREFLLSNIRYVLFVFCLGVFYIANMRYAEKNMRQINLLQKELKELRWQYMTSKSELMYQSNQTQVAKLVDSLGLEELTEPPKKIQIPAGEY